MVEYPGGSIFTDFYKNIPKLSLCLQNTYSMMLAMGVHNFIYNSLFQNISSPSIPWEKLTESTRKLKKFNDHSLHWKGENRVVRHLLSVQLGNGITSQSLLLSTRVFLWRGRQGNFTTGICNSIKMPIESTLFLKEPWWIGGGGRSATFFPV